jgi:hypothetical protein
MSVSAPRRSHYGNPNLVKQWYIVSHESEDFSRVRAVATRAFIIDLAAKLVSERPPHSIDHKPALDPEDDMPEEGHAARWTDVASYPSSGSRVGL